MLNTTLKLNCIAISFKIWYIIYMGMTQKRKGATKNKDKKIIEMSNLILQRNIDAYKELATK